MINKLRELLNAATPGIGTYYFGKGDEQLQIKFDLTIDGKTFVETLPSQEDLDLIKALAKCLPELLAVVDAATELDNWQGDLYEFDYHRIYNAVDALETKLKGLE